MDIETQIALRVKIAELCGRLVPSHLPSGFCIRANDKRGIYGKIEPLPNYPSDLNACAEFEKMLTEEQRYDYIALVLGKSWGDVWTSGDAFNLCHATAEQRCRAFMAVMEAISVPEGNAAHSSTGVSSTAS